MSGKHVAVLMGGWSSERPVSLSSGTAAPTRSRRRAIASPASTSSATYRRVLAELKPDVAFNALHGPFGEDGSIQGILEYLEIPYTHSGVLASALAMNKPQAKTVAASAGIPVAESQVINRFAVGAEHPHAAALCRQAARRRGRASASSSSRRTGASAADHRPTNGATATTVMVERYVRGRELTCGGPGRRGARCH